MTYFAVLSVSQKGNTYIVNFGHILNFVLEAITYILDKNNTADVHKNLLKSYEFLPFCS